MQKLQTLKQLQSLNLVATSITDAGIASLKDLKQLQSIYLYKTKVDKRNWIQLQRMFPKTVLDSGGYDVPLFPNDTVVLKAKLYK